MTTRTLFKLLLLIGALTVTAPSQTFAADIPKTANETPEQRVTRLTQRLEEIRAMDVEKLSKSEKKALKAEVRSIKKEMKKAASGGVYISVGALLLIILLIILLA
jgi:Skp family chaperone for outer membrane proteins